MDGRLAWARALDGTAIAYRVRGRGPRTLLLLHAWGASAGYFDESVDELDLAADRAVAIDLRGHGDSDKPEGTLTWDLLAGDVLAVADAVGA
jgi:non-heme chloroperoxidase